MFARAADSLDPVRVLHAVDARPRADAAGAVELRRAGDGSLPRLRAPPRTAGAVRPCGGTNRGAERTPDHPSALSDRPIRRSRLVDHRRLRLRAGAVGRPGAGRRCARTRGRAATRRLDRDLVGPGGARRGEAEIPAPLERIPVWVRSGSIVVSYRPEDVSAGLGDVPEGERPLVATLWGTPRLGRRAVRLADGTRIAWQGGRLAVTEQRSRREVALVHRPPSGRPGAARCARCARPRARSAARSRRSSWTASPGSWRLAEPSRPAASWRWAEWRPVGSRWAPPVALSATTEGRPRCG